MLAAAAIVSGVTVAQYALDSSQQLNSGRINPRARGPAMARPLYTVNRSTGEMNYNRVHAFREPGYTTYQRYTHSRLDNFKGQSPAALSPRTTSRRIPGATSVSTTRGRSPYGNSNVLARSAGASLNQPRYTTHRAPTARRSALISPTYRSTTSRTPVSPNSTRILRR